MRSEKQRAASRLNGAKSRGPVTSAGKRTVSQNATKHGAYAKAILLPTESGADFDVLVDITVQEFQPATPFEAMLVEDMITARWRAKRFAVMEQALIEQRLKLLEEKAADTAEAGSDAISDLNAADITALACQELMDTSQALPFLRRSAARFSREFPVATAAISPCRTAAATTSPRPSPARTSPLSIRRRQTPAAVVLC